MFRHFVLRDAAYELQVPSERGRLHRLALQVIESALPGAAGVAVELAAQARMAREFEDSPALLEAEQRYARTAAEETEERHQVGDAIRFWTRCAEIGPNSAHAVQRAANIMIRSGMPQQSLKLLKASAPGEIGSDATVQRGLVAVAQFLLGDSEEAEAGLRRALREATESGDLAAQARMMDALGNVLAEIGKAQEAEEIQTRVCEMHQEAGNTRLQAIAVANLAVLYKQTGRLELAEATYRRALALFEHAPDRRFEAMTRGNLAGTLRATGRETQAEAIWLEVLSEHREIGNRPSEATVLGNLAELWSSLGRPGDAERAFRNCLEIHAEVGSVRGRAVSLFHYAAHIARQGRHEEALGWYRKALEQFERTSYPRFEGACLCEYSLSLLKCGDASQARSVWRRGTRLVTQSGDLSYLSELRAGMQTFCATIGAVDLEAGIH